MRENWTEMEQKMYVVVVVVVVRWRMCTYMCSQEDTAHMGFPKLYPANNSRKPLNSTTC